MPFKIYELMYQVALILNETLLNSPKTEHDSVSRNIDVENLCEPIFVFSLSLFLSENIPDCIIR